MDHEALIVRFPDGTKEFRYPEQMIQPDDVLWHDGARYRVISISSDGGGRPVAIVEPESRTLGEMVRSEEGAIRLTPLDAVV